MSDKKLIFVKLEDLFDLKPLLNLLKGSVSLFKKYDNIKTPEDLLSYKLFGTNSSLQNNIFLKIRNSLPKANPVMVKELVDIREADEAQIYVLHETPSPIALFLIQASGLKYDHICHIELKDSLKNNSFYPNGAEVVGYGSLKEEEVKPEPKVEVKEEVKPEPKAEVKEEVKTEPEAEVKEEVKPKAKTRSTKKK